MLVLMFLLGFVLGFWLSEERKLRESRKLTPNTVLLRYRLDELPRWKPPIGDYGRHSHEV